MDDARQLHITLQPDGVAAAANRIIVFATQVIGTALRSLESDDCTQPPSWGGRFGFQFNGLEMTANQRRAEFQNWFIAKGFHDLARGVREGLEEAYMFVALRDSFLQKVTTLSDFQIAAHAAKSRAGTLRFPELMSFVNQSLFERLAFETEFLSLQRVRNCLEHRGGIVGRKDIDEKTGALTLTFPRLKVFYLEDDQEIEIFTGEVINTEKDHVFEKDTAVLLKRVNASRTYLEGEPVIIGQRDFFEIALACQMFVSDLAQKLVPQA